MKHGIRILIIIIAAGALLYGGIFYWKNLRGIGPAINPPSGNIAEIIGSDPKPGPSENTTNMPLKLPDGFSIAVFAKNLPNARVLAFDQFSNLWVSRTGSGVITMLEVKDGKVASQNDVFRNLNKPHGLAFDPKNMGTLYFAEETKITKVATYSEDSGLKIADLPNSGGGHFTRTLGFGPDGRLYVSIGSSCNVCNNTDARRAAVSSMNSDGSDFKSFATGLRNTVFFTWSKDDKLWGTDMGRDLLGDNVPPEEINIIQESKSYGWPICYDDNIHDINFDKNKYIQDPCNDKVKPQVKLQAHSAPLGLAFVPQNSSWPKDYWGDLIVAFHGSWNRSVPTGYKLVRIKLDDNGNYQGTEDFISGWLAGNNANSALGRPVDVKIQPDGSMYVSDDKAGVIYKITPN